MKNKNDPSIGIVTVNWNNRQYSKSLVKQLNKQDFQKWFLIIVNNDIKENLDSLRNDRVAIISNKTNTGYSGGLNRGIEFFLKKRTDINILILMNNDVFFDKSFLKKITKLNLNNLIKSPVILYNKTGKIQNTGGKINILIGGTINLNKGIRLENITKIDPDFLSGCCMIMKPEAIKKIGYFDENYGSYYEDADYSLRAKRKGYKLKIVWELNLQHEHSASTKKFPHYKIKLLARNSIIFAKNHLSGLEKIIFLFSFFFRGIIVNFFKRSLAPFYKGIKEGLSNV